MLNIKYHKDYMKHLETLLSTLENEGHFFTYEKTNRGPGF